MREIKFRYSLELKDTKRYCEWYFTLEEIEQGDFTELFDDRYELLSKDQFIGSKDKNGKEIYEGDIIKSLSFNGILTINEIIYNKKEGAFTLKSGYLFARFKNEVIGNIYENPKLLKKEKK